MNSLFSAILYLFLLHPSFGADIKGGLEDRHQAMYLYNLVRYIDWQTEKIIIGVVGDSPVTSELEKLAKRNTKIEIKSFNDLTSIGQCNIVFLPNANNSDFFLIQEQIGNSPILLVVDKKQLVVRGAEMGFYIENDELKFVVNTKSIEETGIKISHTIMEKARPIN